MRVPVFPNDLAPKSGLKRLEKALQKRWCGSKRINLSFAREVLSKGLGYRDYRDLHDASQLAQPGAPAPLMSEVRRGIFTAIKAALRSEEWLATDPAAWERLVAALPVNVLIAFKPPMIVRLQNSPLTPSERVVAKLAEQVAAESQQLNSEKIERIHNIVAASGNLRDAALLACLMSGMRPSEFLPARVGHVATFTGETAIEVDISKTLRSSPTRNIHIQNPHPIYSYIKGEKLSKGDYLFSAPGRLGCPMTPVQLARICTSWADKAGIEPRTGLPSKIRYSSMTLKYLENQMDIRAIANHIKRKLGHTDQNIINRYFK